MNTHMNTSLVVKDLDRWIDNPTKTKAEPTNDIPEEGRSIAEDIASVTTVPLHNPNSHFMRYGNDIRNGLLMGGSMFALQVAHPQVGAGVGEFSNFFNDPLHRAIELTKSGTEYILKGKEAALSEGERLRELHRNIKGTDKNGNVYHSLNPKVYGWVHIIFLERMITMCELFGEPLDRKTQQKLFLQWQEGGRIFGLRDKDMPSDIDDYFDYFNYMVDEVLEYNEVVDFMMSIHTRRTEWKRPPLIPDFIWQRMVRSAGKRYRDVAMYTFPENYRNKILEHQTWSREDHERVAKLFKRIKWAFDRTPARLHYSTEAFKILKQSTNHNYQ